VNLQRNLCLIFVCAACSGNSWSGTWQQDVDPNEAAMAAATDPIALRIAESADRAATALQDLARVEQTRRPAAPEPANLNTVDELQQRVTIDWVGGAEPLVRNIAQRLQYDVVVVGAPPPVPVVVEIRQNERTVVEALRNIGEQATQYIDLVVNTQARKIEIRYKLAEATQS
jgi:defect-in-organelle-trafficking protein DotD